MRHCLEKKVYYSDTDAYGVVWHGSYLRWMEMGRVEFCRELGLDLVSLERNDIVLPVTNLNIRYKASAKLEDDIIVETRISNISPLTITFSQDIKDKNTGKIFITAKVDVVAINKEGKLHRRMPEILKSSAEKVLEA